MMCVIVEHVCWLGTLGYVADPRYTEMVISCSTTYFVTG